MERVVLERGGSTIAIQDSGQARFIKTLLTTCSWNLKVKNQQQRKLLSKAFVYGKMNFQSQRRVVGQNLWPNGWSSDWLVVLSLDVWKEDLQSAGIWQCVKRWETFCVPAVVQPTTGQELWWWCMRWQIFLFMRAVVQKPQILLSTWWMAFLTVSTFGPISLWIQMISKKMIVELMALWMNVAWWSRQLPSHLTSQSMSTSTILQSLMISQKTPSWWITVQIGICSIMSSLAFGFEFVDGKPMRSPDEIPADVWCGFALSHGG